jgi:hypothetical protein
MIIQVVSFSGRIIDKARWEFQDKSINIGDEFTFTIESKDKNLLSYLSGKSISGAMIEDNYNIILTFRTKKIMHFPSDSVKGILETMVHVEPMDKNIEDIILHILTPSKSNPNFHRMIKNELVSYLPVYIRENPRRKIYSREVSCLLEKILGGLFYPVLTVS